MRELPYAACEGRFISKLFSASGSCHKLEGGELCAEQVKGLRSHLQESKVDLLHLACHFVVSETIDQSSFRLSNGNHLSVQELADCIPDGLRLCFFSACAVGSLSVSSLALSDLVVSQISPRRPGAVVTTDSCPASVRLISRILCWPRPRFFDASRPRIGRSVMRPPWH